MFKSYFHLVILAITAASALSQSAPGPQNGLRGLSSNGPSLSSGLSTPIASTMDFVKADGLVPADPKDAEYLSLAGWWR
jgi:hypothetical protein